MRNRRIIIGAYWGLSLVLVAVLTWWASSTALETPDISQKSNAEETVEVQAGSVGETMAIPVTAKWDLKPMAELSRDGTITAINVESGEQLKAGETLFNVNERPTVIAQGVIPSYRTLETGDRGVDVEQLQDFLFETRYLKTEPDGKFGTATLNAVKKWQDSLGISSDGIVQASDIIYAAELPARIAIADTTKVGARSMAGDVLASTVSPEPTFEGVLENEQAMRIDTGDEISVTGDEFTWDGVITDMKTSEDDDTVRVTITGTDESSLCKEECVTGIPVTSENEGTSLRGQVVITPEEDGPMIPVSTILTDASGDTSVLLPDGEQRDVDVLVESDGQAIVHGLDVGERVQLSPGK